MFFASFFIDSVGMAEPKKPSVGFKTDESSVTIGNGDFSPETEPLRVNINLVDVSLSIYS